MSENKFFPKSTFLNTTAKPGEEQGKFKYV